MIKIFHLIIIYFDIAEKTRQDAEGSEATGATRPRTPAALGEAEVVAAAVEAGVAVLTGEAGAGLVGAL